MITSVNLIVKQNYRNLDSYTSMKLVIKKQMKKSQSVKYAKFKSCNVNERWKHIINSNQLDLSYNVFRDYVASDDVQCYILQFHRLLHSDTFDHAFLDKFFSETGSEELDQNWITGTIRASILQNHQYVLMDSRPSKIEKLKLLETGEIEICGCDIFNGKK